jgi:ornithine cyclodeaminase/alanine dehydrogenase
MEGLFHNTGHVRELPKQEIVLARDDAGPVASAFLMAAETPATACVKILLDVTESRGEPARAARQRSWISVIDAGSTELLGICEGRTVTAYRTAAVSAVATRALARPESKVLGLIGAGNLARLHAIAIDLLFDLDEIIVWSRSAATRDALAKSAPVRTPIRVVSRPDECVRFSDIVCTLTPSRRPRVSHEWVREGTHINAVGSPPRPGYRELTSELVARSRLVVDDRIAALAEAGDIVIPIGEGRIDASHIVGDLGEVVSGMAPGRTAETDITLFKSVGLAIEDAVTARWIVNRVLSGESPGLGA